MEEVKGRLIISFRIKKIIEETPDTKSFELEPINDANLHYVPGQFLTFLFKKMNGEEERRNYSLSSIPSQDPFAKITVKRVPNGEYSRQLTDRAKEGDILQSIGASGFFVLPDALASYKQFVFFAAGSGITPIYALIGEILSRYPSQKIVLIYSNRSIGYTIFYDQLKKLQAQFPQRLHIEFLFSDATHIHHKRLGIYTLEKFIADHMQLPFEQQLFYLCGPFEYMRMITIILRNNGVPAANIRKELFTIEKVKPKEEPADKNPHRVVALLAGKEYSFTAQYPQTILQTAKALNISMPYSCESGQCGTCAATCLSGKVWMWRNDVLLDEEIAKGRVLTCTGYAVGGDVTIVYK